MNATAVTNGKLCFQTPLPFKATHSHLLSSSTSHRSNPARTNSHSKRYRATPTCITSPPPNTSKPQPKPKSTPSKAKLYSTGEKIYVEQQSPESIKSSTPLYIVCPECSTAYLGNAVKAKIKISCASCSHTFETSPSNLYTITDEPELPPPPPNTIQCAHMSICSGCTLSKEVHKPPILKQAQDFFSSLRRSSTVDVSNTEEWRTHAKLAIRRPSNRHSPLKMSIGLFKSKSHQVVAIPGCKVHAKEIEKAIDLIDTVLNESNNIQPYDEVNSTGDIRYIMLTVERHSRLVQLTIVWNTSNWKDASYKIQMLGNELWNRSNGISNPIFHSIWFNWNNSKGNIILNPEYNKFYHMFGKKSLLENIYDIKFTFPPYVFRQSNLDAFEKLVIPKILNYIPPHTKCVELCAGVGMIGIIILKLKQLELLWSSEIHDGAQKEFWNSIYHLKKANQLPSQPDVQFFTGSDEDTIAGMVVASQANVLIVDPPRNGLSKPVVDQLSSLDFSFDEENYDQIEQLQQMGLPTHMDMKDVHLDRIIYVSCNFDSLRRDVKMICSNYNWVVKAVHFFILFPGSNHIETLAIFDRVDENDKRIGNSKSNLKKQNESLRSNRHPPKKSSKKGRK